MGNDKEISPGLGQVRIYPYKFLLSDLENPDQRSLVGKLILRSIPTFNEDELPQEQKSELQQIADDLTTTKANEWQRKSKADEHDGYEGYDEVVRV